MRTPLRAGFAACGALALTLSVTPVATAETPDEPMGGAFDGLGSVSLFIEPLAGLLSTLGVGSAGDTDDHVVPPEPGSEPIMIR